MSRLFSLVVLEKPLMGVAHAFLVQLVSFQAPITGILSAPANNLGSIAFFPTEEGKRVSGGWIENGVYSVSEEEGANAGTHRIEIHWQKPTGKVMKKVIEGEEVTEPIRAEGLPDEFQKNSPLTATVGPGQTTFDFDLKPTSAPPPATEDSVPIQYRAHGG